MEIEGSLQKCRETFEVSENFPLICFTSSLCSSYVWPFALQVVKKGLVRQEGSPQKGGSKDGEWGRREKEEGKVRQVLYQVPMKIL